MGYHVSLLYFLLTLLMIWCRFHIGVAKEHPPLPDPSQLSELGIDFIKCCLTIDVTKRPTAEELLSHPWIQGFT